MLSNRAQPFVPLLRRLYLLSLWCCVLTQADGMPFGIPLVADEFSDTSENRPGCYMDSQHYAYGEMWNPVLIPQGLMVCIRCQCLPVEKKGVLLTRGRTMCRNIKDLCPVPACSNPTLLPGKCCKSCPGDDFEDKFSFRPSVFVNNAYSQDEASPDPDAKEFQALLVGQQVPTGPVPTRAIAVVRLTITGPTTVHYALRYTHLDRPKYLRIVHVNGNVLYKTAIVKQSNGDKKACGEWNAPVPEYLDYIREGKAVVVIATSNKPTGVVAGKIKVAKVNSKEMFNSLLTDKSSQGGGAMASMSYSPKSRTVTYEITTDDVALKGRRGVFIVSVMKGSKVIYKTKGTAMSKTTKLSGRWRVYRRSHRRQLGRGHLRMRVKFSDGHVLVGNIRTKLSCNVFQAVLSGSQTPSKRKTISGGTVLLRLGDDAKLQYSVRLANMVSEVSKIRLEGRRRKKKSKMRNYGNLHGSFVRDDNSTFSGWANGTLKNLDTDAIHSLLTNQLFVSVSVVGRGGRELKGRLVTHDPRGQSHNQDMPIALVPATLEARGGAGLVRLSVDSRCRLRFSAMWTKSPGSSSKSVEVFLGKAGDSRGENLRWLPIKSLPQKRFGFIYVRGEVVGLSDDVMRDLDTGMVFVQMSASTNSREMYRANVTVPNTCWLTPNDAYNLLSEDNRLPGSNTRPKTCRFEGQTYPDGTAWIPDVDQACTTCSCVRGKILCQRMTCPALSCSNPVMVEGRCCPSCPHEDPSEMCQLGEDPRQYPLHSVWHPYLPTDGFSACALCTCLPGKRVKCHKQPCPSPPCPRSDWVKDENSSCCYRCKDNATRITENDDITTQSQSEVITLPQSDIDMQGVCIVNGEIRHEGERWHPTVHPFGFMKCFSCLCQNGSFTCGREQCPVLTCIKRVKYPDQCCEQCADQDPTKTVERIPNSFMTAPPSGCRVADKWYKEGERWKPSQGHDPGTNNTCVMCKCKSGKVECRPRCPKVCREDPLGNPCCQHCQDKTDKTSRVKHRDVDEKRKRKKHRGANMERKLRRMNEGKKQQSKEEARRGERGGEMIMPSLNLMSLLKHE